MLSNIILEIKRLIGPGEFEILLLIDTLSYSSVLDGHTHTVFHKALVKELQT